MHDRNPTGQPLPESVVSEAERAYVKEIVIKNRERIDDLVKRVEALEAKQGQAFPNQDYQPGDEHAEAASHLLHTGEVKPPGSGGKPNPLERPRPHIRVSRSHDGYNIEQRLWSFNPGGWYWSVIANCLSAGHAKHIAELIEPNWFYNHGQLTT